MDTSDFKNGVTFLFNGDPTEVLEFMRVPKYRGGSFVQTKLKNLRSGAIISFTFNGGTKVDECTIDKRVMNYLYDEGDNAVFMNNDTYEQIEIPKDKIQSELNYLVMGHDAIMRLYDGEVLDIILPDKVTLKVIDTPPGERGNSATNTQKEATLETGLKVRVPMFINTGDLIVVNTETGKYDTRAQAA